MSLVLCALLATATPDLRPSVALAPPVPEAGADTWIGTAIADNLEARLLFHSRFDPKSVTRIYPLNVFGWRQALAAARAEGFDPRKPLAAAEAARLQRQLGADRAFFGTYRVDGKRVALTWRLGEAKAKAQSSSFDLSDLAAGTDALAARILALLGQDAKGLETHKLASTPLAAIKPYAQALEILAGQSLDPRAHLVLPRAEVESALLFLTAATDAKPDFVRAWVVRGIASAMIDDMKAAEQAIIQAMATAGEFEPTTSLGLYYVYDRQGETKKAIEVLEEATRNHLGFMQGLGYLGQAYLRASESHEALRVFSTYQTRAPKSPWARVKRAEAVARTGNLDTAIADTAAVLQEFPLSLMALTALASRQIDAKKLVEARATLAQGLKHHPEHPALLTRLSYVELEEGRAAEGKALAERAVAGLGDGRGEPLAGYAQINLAHALGLLGQRDAAIAALVEARRLGVDAEDLVVLWRDPRLKELLADSRNPFRPIAKP